MDLDIVEASVLLGELVCVVTIAVDIAKTCGSATITEQEHQRMN